MDTALVCAGPRRRPRTRTEIMGWLAALVGLVMLASVVSVGAAVDQASAQGSGTATCFVVDETHGGDIDNHLVMLRINGDGSFTSIDLGVINNGAGSSTINVESIAYRAGAEPRPLYTFDPATNSLIRMSTIDASDTMQVAVVALGDIDGLTWRNDNNADLGDDELWAIVRKHGVRDQIIGVHPDSGAIVSGPTTIETEGVTGSFGDVDSLAWDPATDTFFATVNGPDGANDLIAIDPHTGAVTMVGSTGVSDVEGLGITDDGRLFGTTGHHGPDASQLIAIDKSTGAAEILGPIDTYPDYEGLDCGSPSFAVPTDPTPTATVPGDPGPTDPTPTATVPGDPGPTNPTPTATVPGDPSDPTPDVTPDPTPTVPGAPSDPTPDVTPTVPGDPGGPTDPPPTPTVPGDPDLTDPPPTPTVPGDPDLTDPPPTPTVPGDPGGPTDPTPTPTVPGDPGGPTDPTPTPTMPGDPSDPTPDGTPTPTPTVPGGPGGGTDPSPPPTPTPTAPGNPGGPGGGTNPTPIPAPTSSVEPPTGPAAPSDPSPDDRVPAPPSPPLNVAEPPPGVGLGAPPLATTGLGSPATAMAGLTLLGAGVLVAANERRRRQTRTWF